MFLTSPTGRLLRFILGLLLIWEGLFNDAGTLVAVIGVIPILAAIFNFCLLAPLFGQKFFPRKAV
jgi:hypothetical protein